MGLFGSFVQAFKDGYNGVEDSQQQPAKQQPEQRAAVSQEPSHLMPTHTLQSYLDTEDLSLLQGAAAYQKVAHADPILGTKEVDSYFLLHGCSMSTLEEYLRSVWPEVRKGKALFFLDKLPEDGREVIRFYANNVEVAFRNLFTLTLVGNNVEGGTIFYLYFGGDAADLPSRATCDAELTSKDKKAIDNLCEHKAAFEDFASAVNGTLMGLIANLNDRVLEGTGFPGAYGPQDAVLSTQEMPVQASASARPAATLDAPKFCGACGASLEPGTKFCPKCGKPVMGVAPEGQAAPAEPPHLMPTNTWQAYLETGSVPLLEGVAAFQRVTHTDSVFGTEEVNSYFLLRGNEVSIQEVAGTIKDISEKFFNGQLIINVDMLTEDYRQVIRIYSANVGIRFEKLCYFTLIKDDVRDGAVYYQYLGGEAIDILAKVSDQDALTRDEAKKIDEFNDRHDLLFDFSNTTKTVLHYVFGILNNSQMNG